MHRPPTPGLGFAAELDALRPGLAEPYAAALPGAGAAVLSRLWRALAHEPLPWVTHRAREHEGLTLRLADGRRLQGPPADPYTTADHVTEVRLDGRPYADPAALMTALGVPHGAAFAAELADSVASLALSRAAQPSGDVRVRGRLPVPGWEWEQRVVDGHPYHPNCRSRPGFTVAEQLAYGPEHRPLVELRYVAVDASAVTGEWPGWLREGGRVLIPVHPWQAEHVLGVPVLPGPAAHPLMSLRTLALAGGPAAQQAGVHVKTALSTRLTSSVRDISVASIVMAAPVSAFMEKAAAYTDGLLDITRTLGAVTTGSPDLAAMVRESPDAYAGTGERVVPVAALPGTGLPRSAAWLADFARLTLRAGLRLLDLGVALEAHGQNLLVVLSPSGAPLRLVYRDLSDIRVSPVRLARHGIPAPEPAARIITDDVTALRRKLFGSLVAGTLGATAGSTAALRTALGTAVRDLPDTADLAALLEDPLPVKALTLMRLSPGTPGDQWTALPNPLAGPRA
ncbi:IucA/IucC family protein [Streptomyces sp. NPDC059786]|uniref:IucA/IucC family protein n=1 Tax=Streptomyces sp. NPDC059786 TaxID=3346946 RepID=UPI003657723A